MAGLLRALDLDRCDRSVGFGDLSPVGPIRLVSGLESLTGLLLITWSASFTYLEMHQHWTRPDQHD